MNIIDAIVKLRPNAEWGITDDDYANLVWYDTVQTKPTLQEIQDYIALHGEEYDLQTEIKKRNANVAQEIRLSYTIDDEIALIRKILTKKITNNDPEITIWDTVAEVAKVKYPKPI